MTMVFFHPACKVIKCANDRTINLQILVHVHLRWSLAHLPYYNVYGIHLGVGLFIGNLNDVCGSL